MRALAGLVLLVLLAAPLGAQQLDTALVKPGERLRLETTTGRIEGVLLASNADTLVVRKSVWNVPTAVPRSSIRVAELGRRDYGTSMAAGLGIGALAALTLPRESQSGTVLVASMLGGALSGLAFPVYRWIRIQM